MCTFTFVMYARVQFAHECDRLSSESIYIAELSDEYRDLQTHWSYITSPENVRILFSNFIASEYSKYEKQTQKYLVKRNNRAG